MINIKIIMEHNIVTNLIPIIITITIPTEIIIN